MSTVKRLRAENSAVVVIDVQDKLLPKIPDRDRLVRNAGFVLDVAAALAVPVRATEQYPKGLGPTTAEIARRLPAAL
ncbi:MAG: isochorismatase family protein, partial [Planctomycetes bacterium]|nr:isochorismatase family protein [Planctomycetota bacterium]